MTDNSDNAQQVGVADNHVPHRRLGTGIFRFFFLFLMIQGGLFTLEMLQPVHNAVVVPFTEVLAWLSYGMMSLLDDTIRADGVVIWSVETRFAVKIAAGCNGVEATIILFAAILAFSAPWAYKLWGLMWGFLAIHVVNILRIITLFYLGQWNLEVFEWAHLYLWQALIMLDAIIVWLIWIRRMPSVKRPEIRG